MEANTRRSLLWQYFDKSGAGNTSVCKKCKKSIKSCGNTTNLRNHLKAKHPLLFAEMQRINLADSKSSEKNDDDDESR